MPSRHPQKSKAKLSAARSKKAFEAQVQRDGLIYEEIHVPSIVCKSCGRRAILPFVAMIGRDPADPPNDPSKMSMKCICGTTTTLKQSANLEAIIEQLIRQIRQSATPLKTAKLLLADAEKLKQTKDRKRAKRTGTLATLRKFLPQTPEHLTAYIIALAAIVTLLKGGCSPEQLTRADVLKVYDDLSARQSGRPLTAASTTAPVQASSPGQLPRPRNQRPTSTTAPAPPNAPECTQR